MGLPNVNGLPDLSLFVKNLHQPSQHYAQQLDWQSTNEYLEGGNKEPSLSKSFTTPLINSLDSEPCSKSKYSPVAE